MPDATSASARTGGRSASEIWIGYVGQSHADDDDAFAELCAAHPELADELRRCREGYEKAGDLLAVFGKGRLDREAPAYAEGARAGERIGDFELVRRLASGGQGEVWEARQLSLDRTVALKLVLPDRINAKTLALFAREARAGGRLAHSGIVAVRGHGEADGRHWIAQELVTGGRTLRDLLDERRAEDELPEGYYRDVARLVADLADALHAAHELGVIHRDVKPQNVLLTPDGRPKLTDFGLARLADETAVSASGDIAGTWLYMSPEQVGAKRSELDHRTDVFSLGVVLYELLTLQRPFDGDSTQQIASRILFRDPPDPRRLRSRVPRDLAVICAKALEKPKARRYATMAEFAADLSRHLAGEPILARPLRPRDHARRWVRRHPTASAAGFSAALALVVVGGLGLYLQSGSRELDRLRLDLERTTRDQATANDGIERATRELEASEVAAVASAAEARASEEEADRRLQEVLRLSKSKDYEDLVRDADALWPAWPEKIEAMEAWVERAEALVAELPGLRATLAQLEKVEDPTTAGDPKNSWWRNQLRILIQRLESLSQEPSGLLAKDGVSEEHGWSVPRRLAFAKHLSEGFAPGGEYSARWEEALPLIRATYPGLDLPVQMGLAPINPDPKSGLWEFWHIQSGGEPRRREDGVLDFTANSGIVLVLLRGGSFWMGASTATGAQHNYDSHATTPETPTHLVELSPFLLSKYEMSQAQWKRLSGSCPSTYGPAYNLAGHQYDLSHPVESVSWEECVVLLQRSALCLPSEAQWEYGARGDTDSPWWTGSARDFLSSERAANLADQSAKDEGADWPGIKEWPEFRDGYAAHAPVNALSPNKFGLHNVHGNVREWCQDGYEDLYYAVSSHHDPLNEAPFLGQRVSRGGGFKNSPHDATSAHRARQLESAKKLDVGLRPAMVILR